MSANRAVSKPTEELFRVCETGDVQAVSRLLQDPEVDINWQCSQSYGATPLIAAISHGHQEIVQILLNADAELGVVKTPDRNSPLHEAAFAGDPNIMQFVLNKVLEKSGDNAADLLNLQNQVRTSAYLGDTLLNFYVLRLKFGNTPLHNAARTGSPGCVSNLLQAGAMPSIKNVVSELVSSCSLIPCTESYLTMLQNGSIPLHHACYSETPNLEVVRLLVEAGSDVNALDEQGYSPLIVAAKKNQTEVIEYLRKHGADTTLKNSFGEDALHFAELRNNTGAIQLLE
ncbi:E3 ubiquitin-protein ligase MIB1 [Phytophthora nicotianae]|uniref:E3 ubiquitin-protein ligase MIB1 n=1 Tax=Phytophthora nicotianae TaxID=4792 RepID=A0A0W8E1M5_PHYNI|nr:E3 ubiquitin-protein ligase MIB1 [Phytophthora nicotianae]